MPVEGSDEYDAHAANCDGQCVSKPQLTVQTARDYSPLEPNVHRHSPTPIFHVPEEGAVFIRINQLNLKILQLEKLRL